MKTPLILLLATLPSLAAAQGFEGSVVDLQYQKYNRGDGQKIDSLEGTFDAATSFGMLGAQVGLSLGKEVDSSDDISFDQYNGLALHLTADAGDNLRLGAMALVDNRTSGVAFYAAEALYLGGPLRIEGRIGDSLETEDYSILEAKGSYAFGSAFTARAGYHDTDRGAGGGYRVLSVGAGYQVNDGLELYADVGRHKTDLGAAGSSKGSVIDLGVRFNLGGDSSRMFSFQPLN
ncbi:MAG TPA: hypothetical protein VI412_02510 [Tabrizicola sp.]